MSSMVFPSERGTEGHMLSGQTQIPQKFAHLAKHSSLGHLRLLVPANVKTAIPSKTPRKTPGIVSS